MDRVMKLLAFLSTKSAEVPEVVKEELKSIAKDVSTSDVLEVFKDLLTGYIVEQKKEGLQLVDTKKFDVLEKDSWVKKAPKEPELPQAVKDQLASQEKIIADLKLKDFTKDVETKVGTALVKEFTPLYGKLADADITKILDVVKFQQDIISELGKAQLTKDNTYVTKIADLETKIAAFAKERGMTVMDAYAAYGKEHPDEMAVLNQ